MEECNDESIKKLERLGQDVQTIFRKFHTALNASPQNVSDTVIYADQLDTATAELTQFYQACEGTDQEDKAVDSAFNNLTAIINGKTIKAYRHVHGDFLKFIPEDGTPSTLEELENHQYNENAPQSNIMYKAEHMSLLDAMKVAMARAAADDTPPISTELATGGIKDWEHSWHGFVNKENSTQIQR